MFAKEAERRVALGLIVSEIVKQQDLKVDAARVRKMVEDIADAYEKPAEIVSMYYNDKNRLAGVEAFILEEQVVDQVLEQAKVTEKPSAFDEL